MFSPISQFILEMLNSEFFVGFATLAVAGAAFLVYRQQQRDSRKDAARIILLEIQNAERLLRQAQEKLRATLNADKLLSKKLLPVNSWNKHKYLFVREFDRDEWDRIEDFYNRCQEYDAATSYNQTFFEKNEEQIRSNLLRATAEYLKENLTLPVNPLNVQRARDMAAEFQRLYLEAPNLVQYEPMKPINDARAAIEGVDYNLSQSAAGTKLKQIAGI